MELGGAGLPARAGRRSGGARRARQTSLAVSGDGGRRWVLLNASPDLPAQLRATPALHPAAGGGRRPAFADRGRRC